MRRIQPPKCTCCTTRAAMYESDVWPTVRLCLDCRNHIVEYFFQFDCVYHGNPLAIELFGTEDNGDRPDAIRIWRRVENQSSTFRELYVRRHEDSRSFIENSLDILDDL